MSPPEAAGAAEPTLDGVVPGVAVLVGLALALGGVAVRLLSRASSAAVE